MLPLAVVAVLPTGEQLAPTTAAAGAADAEVVTVVEGEGGGGGDSARGAVAGELRLDVGAPADQADGDAQLAGRQDRSGDRLRGGVVAPHRVQSNPHGLLLLLFGFFIGRYDDPALEEPAIRADPVRQDRLV